MANFTTDGQICIEREVDVNQTSPIVDVEHDFEVQKTCQWIKDNGFQKVCLQFPDGLLHLSAQLYENIKNKIDVDLYILGDTSYASCCVDSVAARHVNADAVIHYGRSCLSKTDIPTYNVLPKRQIEIQATLDVVKTSLVAVDNTKICLFYDQELQHCLEEISSLWYKLFPNSRIAYLELEEMPNRFLGRVLRDTGNKEYPATSTGDCVCIYVGSKGQTFFNYCVSYEAKQWYIIDPVIKKLEPANESTWFKRRRFLIEKCKDAEVIGILICKLSGEQTKDIISRMKKICKANGKKSYIVSVGKPNEAKLANFPEINLYVMIACPENDLYSCRDYYAPIVYPYEMEVALNSNRPQYSLTHVTDFDELLPGRQYYCDIANVQDSTDVSLITGKIRETKVTTSQETSNELVEKQNWALENIGKKLQERSWAGLEQKLGETEVKMAEQGRKGIPLQYSNEPE